MAELAARVRSSASSPPSVVAIVNRPLYSPLVKRIVANVVTLVLTLLLLAMHFAITKEALPEWPQLLLLAIMVSQAGYALVLDLQLWLSRTRRTDGSFQDPRFAATARNRTT